MVHILGIHLPDNQIARFALTHVYGIGHHTAHRLCARLQIHDTCRVKYLTQPQLSALASFLSSPGTAAQPVRVPVASVSYKPPPPSESVSFPMFEAVSRTKSTTTSTVSEDPLRNLKIESELKTLMRENIAHQRMIGSYIGKRHAMHLPVRGQNTRSNARTARKLNKVERKM